MLYYGLTVNSQIKHSKNKQHFSNRLLHKLTFYNDKFVDDFSTSISHIKKTTVSYNDKNNKLNFFKARVDLIVNYLLKDGTKFPSKIKESYPFLKDKKIALHKDTSYFNRIKLLYNSDDFDVSNEKIKTTFIYFIHIDNFNINNNMYSDIKNGTIRTSQLDVDEKKVQKYQKLDVNTLPNVIVSVIGTFDTTNKIYYIQYDLDDGNHRLTALKLNKYDGYVPVLFVDELTDFDTMSKYDRVVRNIDNRIFKNSNETSNTQISSKLSLESDS